MGRKAIDITGQRFGKLTVLSRAKVNRKRSALWNCLCDCGVIKDIPGHNLRSGRVRTCNTGCKRLKGSRWSRMTPKQKRMAFEANKRYWSRNKERLAAKKKKHYHKFRDKYLNIERERSYRKLYGIGIAEYDVMLQAQDGRCAICRSDKVGKAADQEDRFFCVDHCHETGKVRGLLCVACNTRLGYLTWFEKNKEAVARYLSPKPYLKVVA